MKLLRHLVAPLTAAMLLSSCGGGDGNTPASTPPPPPATTQRGALLDMHTVTSLEPSALLSLLANSDLGQLVLQLAYVPKCTITVYQLDYETVDARGTPTPSSGALMVPSGSDSGCSGGRPLLLYAHGTTADRNFDIAQLTAADDTEGVVLAAVFAAEGYIVVAPNYVGYATSTAGYHPYLLAEQQSNDMSDALTAARSALPTQDVPGSSDGGKLFITGYSEGGYVAMATHAALQSAGAAVTASAPMSGPYALAAFGDAIFEGEVNSSAPVNLTFTLVAYQKAYGDIYATPADAIASPYAATIETLLPSTDSVGDLEAQGKFPPALFSSTPPSPGYSIYTPATQPASLAAVFAAGFGGDFLITNSYRGAYLADALAAPDGGFPTLTSGVPAASPANALRIHLKANDLRNWSPAAPTLLCGGSSDPTVFFFNTTLMQAYWTAHAPAVTPVVLDVDSAATANDPYASIKSGFAAAKAAVSAQGGDAAVLADYHAGLVPPFCLSAVKSFFDAH